MQESVQQYGQLHQEKADNFPLEAGIIQSVTRQMRMIKNAISATGSFRGNPLLPCQYTLPCPRCGTSNSSNCLNKVKACG